MLRFSQFFWNLVIIGILLIIVSFIYLWITKSEDKIKNTGYFSISIICLIIILTFCEEIIINNFDIQEIILIFDLEIILSLILFSLLYFAIQSDFRSEYIIFIHSTLTILFFHILVAGIFRLIIVGTIIIGMICLIILAIIIPYDEEYKVIIGLIITSLFFYISWAIGELFLAIILLGSIIFIISLCNESFRGRLMSFYQKTVINLKKVSFKTRNSNLKNKSKKDKILFYHARVKVKQGAIKQDLEKKDPEKENETSWLQDFFYDRSRYGVEIISHKDFRWAFFMKARNEKEARILGEALLTRLTSIYPGLDGEVEVKPITKSDIYKKNYFWEIKLPKAPYLEEITLIRDFTNLFHRNKQEIKLYIQWKKATPKKIVKIREKIERMKFKDDKEKERYLETWREMLFKVRIFVSYQIFEKNPKERELELQLIEGRLKSLTMSSKNLKKPARLRSVTSGTLGNILRANLFSGRYVTPKCIDFDIHENIPLFKPFILEHENVEFPPITEDDPDYIFIGKYLERGRRTEKNMPVHKNVFAQSALIVGQQGTGKTYLLAQIIQEFYDKCPDIGILILNLGKGNQEGFYKMDRVIKFGSPDFRVPYFYRGQYLERSLQETAAYLVAATGLKNVVEKNMINTMQAFINKYGKLSDSIYSLFKNLIDYFVKHPYHDRFQTNILRALKNRVLSLLTNPNLQKTLRLSNDSKIPTWFKEWRDGKKIYLDISMCSIYEKRLLTSAIFQMVRALTPDIELGKLQNIIVIDEAHQILEKPVSRNFDDDDFISRDQLEKIFNELLREFRSKGLSFILADQTPSRLFDCVTTLPSLKIIFRVGYPCNKIMIGNPKEQELLMLQRNRQALVLNGISGHKYLIESLDFVLPNKIRGENKDVINCPYCHTPVDNDAEYCMFCGKPLVLELPETAN